MGFISQALWNLRTKPGAWGLDVEGHADIVAGEGRPRAGVRLWGRQCALTLRAGKDKRHKIKQTGAKKWEWELKNPGILTIEEARELRFPDGSIFAPEFGLTVATLALDRRPAEPFVDFDLDLPAGVQLAYQPAVTPAERDGNGVIGPATRPAWAVGSFGAFLGGAKLGHIPRPFAVDADGNWTWGAAEVLNLGGQLVYRKTFPAAWLAAARLPLVVDASMGYTTAGGTTSTFAANYVGLAGGYAGVGSATSVSMYCFKNPAAQVTLGIYNAAKSLQRDTAGGSTPTAAAWVTLNLDSAAALAEGVVYWLAWNWDGTSTYYYDVVDQHDNTYIASTYVHGTLPAGPLGTMSYSSVNGQKISIYATYTPTAAGGGLLVHPGMAGGMRG